MGTWEVLLDEIANRAAAPRGEINPLCSILRKSADIRSRETNGRRSTRRTQLRLGSHDESEAPTSIAQTLLHGLTPT